MIANIGIVFRIRWINARAGVDRCDEELAVLRVEMALIYCGYGKLARDWTERAERMRAVGGHETHVWTALENEEVWKEYAERARHTFNDLVPGVIE